MIAAAMLIKSKGYIHTDITSKSWRYFPDKIARKPPPPPPPRSGGPPQLQPKNNFYTDKASGHVKLSGFQHAVVLAKADKPDCRIRRTAYAMPR